MDLKRSLRDITNASSSSDHQENIRSQHDQPLTKIPRRSATITNAVLYTQGEPRPSKPIVCGFFSKPTVIVYNRSSSNVTGNPSLRPVHSIEEGVKSTKTSAEENVQFNDCSIVRSIPGSIITPTSPLLPACSATSHMPPSTPGAHRFGTNSFSRLPLGVLDIDYPERFNEHACASFALQINRHSLAREKEGMSDPDYMILQGDISWKMRSILIDWVFDVHKSFPSREESLYLTVSIIDRFLSEVFIKKSDLQLVGVTALFIATKLEDGRPPPIDGFLSICDGAYNMKQMLRMEMEILKQLDYNVAVPFSLLFLRRVVKAAEASLKTPQRLLGNIARYATELALQDYQMLGFRPSVIAAASVLLAGRLACEDFFWDLNMAFHAGKLSEKDLLECEKELRRILSNEVDMEGTNDLTAIKRKFMAKEFGAISMKLFLNGEKLMVLR